jgi:hypothetical protein
MFGKISAASVGTNWSWMNMTRWRTVGTQNANGLDDEFVERFH